MFDHTVYDPLVASIELCRVDGRGQTPPTEFGHRA